MTWGIKIGSDYDFEGCPLNLGEEEGITWERYYHQNKDGRITEEELRQGFLGALARELCDKYNKKKQ